MNIAISVEGPRGCGFRKPGGLYLVCPGEPVECCKLPLPLTVCHSCGHGIKPTRGWTWITPDDIFGETGQCESVTRGLSCLLARELPARAGLLWIGEQYYATPEAFCREAKSMGISRRIATIPRGFALGETWVFLAHRKTQLDADNAGAAVFGFFKPARVEYVVREGEAESDPDKLERLEKQGVTLVDVKPLQMDLQELKSEML